MIGSKLGPYEIIEEVGRGGMAAVYRAYQPNVDRFVAIKVIFRSIAADSKALDRFQREARLVAKLEHPHILPVYDYNGLNDPPYIVMRYLPTGTLKEVLQREQLPFHEVAYLLTQIASALDYAHRQGVIHRDIKPSNIMVDAEGNAFLTDFGIARITESTQTTQGLTGTGVAIGTPGYMSPEQGMGQPLDGRADIYSLGVMVYEMLTGQIPYRAETPMAVILKHINDPLPVITQANTNLPPAVNAIIQRSMAKKPEDRYTTATEMARALGAALGPSEQVAPLHLQAAAARTIQELEAARAESAKTQGKQPTPGALTPVSRATPPVVSSTGAPSATPRPPMGTPPTGTVMAARGAALGAGAVILLIALVALGAFIATAVINNNTSATTTAVANIGLTSSVNSTGTGIAIAALQTSSVYTSSTATVTVSPTIANTATATTNNNQGTSAAASATGQMNTAVALAAQTGTAVSSNAQTATYELTQAAAVNGTITADAVQQIAIVEMTKTAQQPTRTPAPTTETAKPTNTVALTFTSTPRPATTVPPATTMLPATTRAASATNTATKLPPTAADTATRVPPTATRTRTSTPVPPTATSTATHIPPTATFTLTPVPPTATVTASHTATAIPPTATASNTATPVPPTASNTATFTLTPVPPSATLTATASSTATFTATAVPPTETAVPNVPPTAAPIVTPTPVPLGRLPYVTDMEAPDAISQWDYDPSAWRLLPDSGNTSLVGTGGLTKPAVVLGKANPDWTDSNNRNLLISVSTSLDANASSGRIIFRYSNTGYYVLEVVPGLLKLRRGQSGKIDRPTEKDLPQGTLAGAPIRSGTFYHWLIWADDNRVFVYLEHRLIMTVKDPAATLLPGGAIIFQTLSASASYPVRFDDLKVQRPSPVSQHFEGSGWPNTWTRSNTTDAVIGDNGADNHYIEQSAGEVAPKSGVLTDFLLSARLQSIQGGFDLHVRESAQGYYLFKFTEGNMILSIVDNTGKVQQVQSFPNFYDRSILQEFSVEMVGRRVTIYNKKDVWSQEIKDGPLSGELRFLVTRKDDGLRIDDFLIAETAKSATETAQWAFDKIAAVEARNPAQLLTEFYDYFVDKFAKRDWWEGGANAPGEPKYDGKSRDHANYLEMTYQEGASWRIFRYVPGAFLLFGAGNDKQRFFDSSDLYVRVNIRLSKPGTAWVAARTSKTVGGGSLDGYRLALTHHDDGTNMVEASGFSTTGQKTVYFSGPLPASTDNAHPEWVTLLIVTYQDKIAFFANGRFLNAQQGIDILGGTCALGVEKDTIADFDNFQLRDVSPETR